jgi:tetratricopeptide (TPR) repeat protein
MGHLHDRKAWLEELPEEIVTALANWVKDERHSLQHRRWFTTGRSGAPVALVLRKAPGDLQQLALKFCDFDGGNRVLSIRAGWQESPGFRTHLAQPEDQTIRLGDWRAVFMRVAGGDIRTMLPLTDLHKRQGFPDYCATVVRSVLLDWTENQADMDEILVSVLLKDMMGRRRDKAEEWARKAGIAIDEPRVRRNGWPTELPNPFAFIRGPERGRRVEDFLVGKAHGDLSGRNVLVPTEPDMAAERYVLIDYDRYSGRAPLARDPMHLLVALVLDRFGPDELAIPTPDLAEVVVHPHTKDVWHLEPFRQLSQSIHTASVEMAVRSSTKAEWRQQCLLSLIGVGLVHLGRKLHVRDEDAVKEWCFHVAALAAKEYLQHALPLEPDDVAAAMTSPAMRAKSTPPKLVDREDVLEMLRTRLTSGSGGVVVVRGPGGIGKTALVDTVLHHLANADGTMRVHHHTVDATIRLDAGILIDYISGESDFATGHTGGSSLAGLEAVLQRLGDSRVVVVLDSAENLVGPETNKLDPDLDKALELLAAGHEHRVTVLLVTNQDLGSATDETWPNAEPPIFVGRLPFGYFFEYLESLDRAGRMVSADFPDRMRRQLYARLQGNPRLAELVYAVVVIAETGFDLRSLTDWLLKQDAKDVPAHLARVLFDGLSPVQRCVLQALALFDTPVPASAVVFMCDDDVQGKVEQALTTLAAIRIVRHVDGEYSVLPEDGRLVLTDIRDEADRRRLYRKAARQLMSLRNREPRGFNDLRVHFAELNALLRVDEPGEILEMIRDINDVLREWNCSERLRQPREQIRSRLCGIEEMVNENALGGIYVELGRFDLANDAYGRALKIAQDRRDDVSKMQTYANFAAMNWQHNDTELALGYYELARDEALRLDHPVVLMGALEGMADCHRRRGHYEQAIRYAENALAVPELASYPDSPEAQRFATTGSVAVALKLARWCGELGRAGDAERLIDVADSMAAGRLNNWLAASCLDGRADMLYDQGDYELAASAAQQAVERALRLRDEVTLLQARTTLCLAYLRTDRAREAYSEIEAAHRYRQKWRSLVVLALYGLAARWKEDRAEADRRFEQLRLEADDRIARDREDFTAWDFRGLAICGRRMDSRNDDLGDAIRAFEFARSPDTPTPILVDRLRFILVQLDKYGRWPGRLRPVIDVLSDPSGRIH